MRNYYYIVQGRFLSSVDNNLCGIINGCTIADESHKAIAVQVNTLVIIGFIFQPSFDITKYRISV